MFNNTTLLESTMNTTMNTTGLPPAPMFAPMIKEPLFMRVIRLATYIIIFLIAVFGNSLVIFVVYKTKELHTGKWIADIIERCAATSRFLSQNCYFFLYIFFLFRVFNNCLSYGRQRKVHFFCLSINPLQNFRIQFKSGVVIKNDYL